MQPYTYGHISDWNTSAVLYMFGAFENRTEFNQDISNWDVSSVRHMVGMFKGAVSFNQNIGNWDIHSATNLQGMFEEQPVSIRTLEVGKFQKLETWAVYLRWPVPSIRTLVTGTPPP